MDLTWFDFGGQAVFYPTHQFFLTAHCVYLLCFKFGDEESVQRVEYWLRNVGNFTRDPTRPAAKLIIVGTHADQVLEQSVETAWDNLKPAMASQSSHIVGHVAVSCTTGQGVEGIVRGIGLAMDAAKLTSVQVPKSYSLIECFIMESRMDTSLARMQWKDVVSVFPALSETHLRQAFDFFTDMGLCVFEWRLGLLIMDPQWLANAFSKLVSFSGGWVKDGIVSSEHCRHVWKELSDNEESRMMQLLEAFEVAFPKRSEGLWIIPSMLPSQKPGPMLDLSSVSAVPFMRMFKFEVLPFGLFGRLVARFQEWTRSDESVAITELWREGIVLQLSTGGQAEIKIDNDGEQQVLIVQCAETQKEEQKMARPRSATPPPLAQQSILHFVCLCGLVMETAIPSKRLDRFFLSMSIRRWKSF